MCLSLENFPRDSESIVLACLYMCVFIYMEREVTIFVTILKESLPILLGNRRKAVCVGSRASAADAPLEWRKTLEIKLGRDVRY